MKIINIDFTDSSVGTLGRAGEHNNTRLVFSLAPELTECDLISAEVCTANGEKIPVEGETDNENKTFAVMLTSQLTVEGSVTLQLVGCVLQEGSDEPQVIAKSPLVSGTVAPSVNGIEVQAESEPSLLHRIWAKVESFHKHRNLSLLDKLTEKMLTLLTDGAVVGNVETAENDDGITVLRLRLLRQDVDPDKTAFIDLPVFGTQDIYLESEGCFGLAADIGLTEYRPMQKIASAPGRYGVTEIYPNCMYVFGEVDELHIFLKNGSDDKVCSYYFSFVAHDMTALTLPDEVRWGNGNEITVEGGKRYEVSIVDDIALWCAVEVSG